MSSTLAILQPEIIIIIIVGIVVYYASNTAHHMPSFSALAGLKLTLLRIPPRSRRELLQSAIAASLCVYTPLI